MREFLVTMKETKFYLVATENDDWTPDDLANEFLAHDGNHVMQIRLAGTGEREMEVVEMGDPDTHFYGPEGDLEDPWEEN